MVLLLRKTMLPLIPHKLQNQIKLLKSHWIFKVTRTFDSQHIDRNFKRSFDAPALNADDGILWSLSCSGQLQ